MTSRRASGFGLWDLGFIPLLFLFLHPGVAVAQQAQDMPDPSLIHGRAIPAPELPDGTVTVRVVREALGNDLAGQQVRVTVGGTTRTATTDELGRAEFKGLPAGEARAEVTVEREALASQPFPVPTAGGLRVILVAGLERAAERRKQEEAAAAAAPAAKGTVVIGGDSRIVMEFNNDALFAFYVLEVVNNARTRIDIGGPLTIELPSNIGTASLMEGSSPSVSVDGRRIIVQGPFASGVTPVNVQFNVQFSSSTRSITQTFPVPLERVVVGVEKVSDLSMSSPQFASASEVPTESGTYVLGQGPSLPAGTPLTITLTNLPAHSRVPRYLAIGLALALAGLGTWLAVTARGTGARQRQALVARRDVLLAELAGLEAKYRDRAIPDERYESRRQRLMSQIEQIYGELDDANAGPQGGGEGLAA